VINNLCSNQYTDGEYLKKVGDWHGQDSYWKAHKVLEMIQKHKLTPNSIDDIGCGAGEVLVEIQKNMAAGLDFRGFDISPQAISIASKKETINLKFYNEDFLESEVNPPDLLLLLDVFEHISNYRSYLNSLRKKTDRIIFHVPLDIAAKEVLKKSDYMLYMHHKYGHLHFFTKETALITLSDLGYDVIDYFYTDDLEIEGVPWGIKPKLSYGARKIMFRLNPEFTASLFKGYNLLVLARGDRKHE
jgi:SAM-dependent methyltransferase